METEIWKDIEGYEGMYEVSNLGRIKSIKFGKEKILNLMISNKGYATSRLSIKGIWKNKIVSRLVAIHFIENPLDLPCVCHKDETLIDGKLYNGSNNLFWGTYKDNMQDMIKKGRDNNNFKKNNPKVWKGKFGKDHNSSIEILQYDLQGNFIREWESLNTVQKIIGVKGSNISSCCRFRRKTAGGFVWKYKNK